MMRDLSIRRFGMETTRGDSAELSPAMDSCWFNCWPGKLSGEADSLEVKNLTLACDSAPCCRFSGP